MTPELFQPDDHGDLGFGSHQVGPEISDDPSFLVSNYLRILRRRWIVVALVFTAVFLGVYIATRLQTRIYESSTKLVVATKSEGSASSNSILSSLDSLKKSRTVGTQVEIINNQDLLEAAFRKLPPSEKSGGFHSDVPPQWSYDIKAKPDTDVILITTHAYLPQAGADFGNNISDEYLDEDLIQNNKSTSQALKYVKKQLGIYRDKLDYATFQLSRFKKKTGLLSVADQVRTLSQDAATDRSAVKQCRRRSGAAKAKLDLLRRQLLGTSGNIQFQKVLSANPEFSLVQSQIIGLESQIAQQSQEYLPTSPELTTLRSQLAVQQRRFKDLSKTSLTSETLQNNPVRIKLLQDYGEAEAMVLLTSIHDRATNDEFGKVRTKLNTFPEQERKLSILQRDVEDLGRTYAMLSEKSSTLDIDSHSNLPEGIAVGKARLNLVPSSPNPRVNLIFGLLAAVVSGLGVALLVEMLDSKLHSLEEVERISGLRALSYIPQTTSDTGRTVIGEVTPGHAFIESFRVLRSNVEFAAPDIDLRLLAVTSAAMGDGKSTVAANMAMAFAMDGRRVLIVDADLRRPTVHKVFELRNEIGFSNLARGTATYSQAIVPSGWENLECLPSGPLPPDPTEFLNSRKSRQLFVKLAGMYDLVILDSPPCAGLSDMQVISKVVQGVVLVAGLDKTAKPMFYSAVRMLRQAGAPILGLVINRMKRSASGYNGYYGYYGEAEYGSTATPQLSQKEKAS